MLRTWTRWIGYPIVMVAVLLVATIPAALSRGSEVDAATNQFRITNFTADYVLMPQPDGTTDVLVTERIEASFSQDQTNRGILRAIPLRYQNHVNTLTDVAVTGEVRTSRYADGRGNTPMESSGPQPFTHTVEKDIVLLRIGDAGAYLQRGRQVWELRYRLGDVALNAPDRLSQEIYLDANGSGWEVPFSRVTARLHVPGALAGRLNGNAACYWGPEGSTQRCTTTTATEGDTTVITGRAENLGRRSGLTLAVGFTNGTFPVAYTPTREAWPWWLFVFPALGLVAYLIALVRHLRVRGVGKPRVIVTEYLPPKGVPAIAAADIIGHPEKGPAAQLIELVATGQVRLRSQGGPTRPDGPARRLGFWRRRQARRALQLPWSEFDRIEDPALCTLMEGYFGNGFGHGPDGPTAAELATTQENLIVNGGWREPGPWRTGGWFFPVYLLFLIAGGIGMYAVRPRGADFWLMLASAAIGVVLLIAAVHREPTSGALTEEGRRIRAYLFGLEQFITMAEANRIAWLQGVDSAPRVTAADHEGLVKLYEPLLPYAVILGHEQTWTAVLGEHHRALQVPDWFSQLDLGVSLGDFVRTLDHPGHRDSYGFRGSQAIRSTNTALGDGVRGFGEAMGDAMAAMAESRNDGGGSRWGGGGSGGGWSSGGSSGGGRSGGGMGGGGGGGW